MQTVDINGKAFAAEQSGTDRDGRVKYTFLGQCPSQSRKNYLRMTRGRLQYAYLGVAYRASHGWQLQRCRRRPGGHAGPFGAFVFLDFEESKAADRRTCTRRGRLVGASRAGSGVFRSTRFDTAIWKTS